MKRILLFLFVALIVTIGSAYAQNTDASCPTNANGGKDCYIATTGNDLTGNGTIGSPWKTPIKCFSVAHADGVCYMWGGTYDSEIKIVDVFPGWYFGNTHGWDPTAYHTTREGTGGTAGHPVTIRSYPGEMAIWTHNSDSGCGSNLAEQNGNVHYITYSDFTIKSGRIRFNDPTGETTIERLVIHMNSRMSDNPGMLYSGSNGVNGITNFTIRDNLFISDNTDPLDGGCTISGGQGQFFTDLYSWSGGVIEHNDFLVTSDSTNTNITGFIGYKAWDEYVTIQNNYMSDLSNSGVSRCIWSGNSTAATGGNLTIRYNTCLNAGSIWTNLGSHDDLIYNNTIYNSQNACWTTAGSTDSSEYSNNQTFFNNICVGADTAFQYDGSATKGMYLDIGGPQGPTSRVSYQTLIDWNIYWKIGSQEHRWKDGPGNGTYSTATDASGLTNWQNYLDGLGAPYSTFEDNSRFTDPGLTDPGAGDFSLVGGASARTGGRGGAYQTWLGADDPNSTTDYFGCTFDSRCHSYAFAAAPAGSNVRGAVIRGGTVK